MQLVFWCIGGGIVVVVALIVMFNENYSDPRSDRDPSKREQSGRR